MTNNDKKRPVAVVAGAGPGNGQAIAKRFSDAGYTVALLARDTTKLEAIVTDIANARSYSCDVGEEASVQTTFAEIRQELGDVDALLYNAGSGVFADIEEITPDQFETAWRVNAYGALLCSKQVIPAMKARGKGSIIFTGATASLRGNVKTAAFAPAKAAQRSLAQSMARALWPQGIHVALIIVDGVVEKPGIEAFTKDKPVEALIDPAALAQTVYDLTRQSPRGWSFEVEVRPALETW